MLRSLSLRDFVIVDQLELDFSIGFSALTGETGAGKSILIDALGLLLGDRADAGIVRHGRDRAEISATFDTSSLPDAANWLSENDFQNEEEPESVLLRRVMDSHGRSRAYLNGTPATIQQLREIGEFLVDIHGQNAHQSLLKSDVQRQLLDKHGGFDTLLQETAAAFRVWQQAAKILETAQNGAENLARDREEITWQVEELSALAFETGEWERLEGEHRLLAHAAGLQEGAQHALLLLGEGGSTEQIDAATHKLSALKGYDPSLDEITALLISIQNELAETLSSLRRYLDKSDLDPSRLEAVEARMDAILSLARKYRSTPEKLPALLADSEKRLESLDAAADIETLQKHADTAKRAYDEKSNDLSAKRKAEAKIMADAITVTMQHLALGSGRFEITLTPLENPTAHGKEQVVFCIGSHAAREALPLAKVASGGELSRISLAIQVETSRLSQVPTLIFDEVDVGIGGGVAEIVGKLLRQLGKERQVLCVTHLPQVAALAHAHWCVEKNTVNAEILSKINTLDEAARVEEIARMLGGIEITATTRQHAKELLMAGKNH